MSEEKNVPDEESKISLTATLSGNGSGPDVTAGTDAEKQENTDSTTGDVPNGDTLRDGDKKSLFETNIHDTDVQPDTAIEWFQCLREPPLEEPQWRNAQPPREADAAILAGLLDQPGFRILPDLAEEEMDQVMYWLTEYVTGWEGAQKWFLRGEAGDDGIELRNLYAEMIQEIKNSEDNADFLNRFVTGQRVPAVVVVSLEGARVILEKSAIEELHDQLSAIGTTLLVMMEAPREVVGQKGAAEVWWPDLEQFWWRSLFWQVSANAPKDEADAEFDRCMTSVATRRAEVSREIKDLERKRDLRTLLLSPQSEVLEERTPANLMDAAIRRFIEQDTESEAITKMLRAVFRLDDDGSHDEFNMEIDLKETEPYEPHATALFVIWAGLSSIEHDNVRIEWADALIEYQASLLQSEENEAIARIEADQTLAEYNQRKKIFELSKPFTEFLSLQYSARARFIDKIYTKLQLRKRHDSKRGNVLEFKYPRAVRTIRNFLETEVSHYLELQSKAFLSKGQAMFSDQEAVSAVGFHLQAESFERLGAISEGFMRDRAADDLVEMMKTANALWVPSHEQGGRLPSLRMPANIAAFLVFWYRSALGENAELNAQTQDAFKRLTTRIAERLVPLSVNSGPKRKDGAQKQKSLVIPFLTRLVTQQEELIELRPLLRLMGNNASEDLREEFADFVNSLGGVRQLSGGETMKAPSKKRDRMQYRLFEAIEAEITALDEKQKGDFSHNDMSRLLSTLVLRVIGNALVRASVMDFRETSTPELCSDRFLTRLFEDDDGMGRVVKLLLRPRVSGYPMALRNSIKDESSFAKVLKEDLKELVLLQFMISSKTDFGSDAEGDLEDAQQLYETMKERVGDNFLDYTDDETIKLSEGYCHKLLIDFHSLLASSGRTELAAAFEKAFAEETTSRRDRMPFRHAYEMHVAFINSLGEIAKKRYQHRDVDRDGVQFALQALLKRREAAKMLKITRLE